MEAVNSPQAQLDAPLDPETKEMIVEALERAKREPAPVTVLSVHFNKELRLLIVRFSTGRRLAIPQEDLQCLAVASVEDAADVTIEMLGRAIHWEKLDLDFSVDGLLAGRRGNATWMDELRGRWFSKDGVPQLASF